MKAIDTNILVYAHRAECEFHKIALALLTDLSESAKPWAIPMPCIYEFLRVVSHPRIYNPPTPILQAWGELKKLFKSPSLTILTSSHTHWNILDDVMRNHRPKGNLVHDAHIVSLMLEHGISEIITADSDFKKFDNITVVNPFM